VKKIINQLKELGHDVTYDWTDHEFLGGQAGDNIELSRQWANDELNAVILSDVYVLLSDEQESTGGRFTELGTALGVRLVSDRGPERIFVVGDHSFNIFYWHPLVIRVDTFDDVLRYLGIK